MKNTEGIVKFLEIFPKSFPVLSSFVSKTWTCLSEWKEPNVLMFDEGSKCSPLLIEIVLMVCLPIGS